MKILVTGGAGLIGSHLCRKLLDLGHRVVAFDNLITGVRANIQPLLENKSFTFKKVDITTEEFFREISNFENFDEIYHLACPTGVPNLQTLGEEMLLTCSLGTENVLKLAQKTNAKVLFTSSSEVYGDPQVSPQDESYSGNVDPLGFRSTYEEGKRFSETLCMLYFKKLAVATKIVRLFNTYGPTKSKDTRVISQFLNEALSGAPLVIYGTGLQTRTFCYVDDTIAALILVMESGKSGEVYNIGSDNEISISDLAKTICDVTSSKSKITFVSEPFPDHRDRKPDISKIKNLGWKQKIALDEGLKRMVS